MIGVDTNILLRFALEDDRVQSPRAIAFLRDPERFSSPAMICPVALVEFVWTMGRKEGFTKGRLLEILDAFTESRRITYSDESLVQSCIEQWRTGDADLPDYLIAALNLQAGAGTTVTLDETAAEQPGFTLLPS